MGYVIHVGIVLNIIPFLCTGTENVEFIPFGFGHFDTSHDERFDEVFGDFQEAKLVGGPLGHRF